MSGMRMANLGEKHAGAFHPFLGVSDGLLRCINICDCGTVRRTTKEATVLSDFD